MKLTLTSRSAFGKREAAQHHAVDDAEHRRHAADAEREDDDGQRAEGLLLDQDAETDLDVTEHAVLDAAPVTMFAPPSPELPCRGFPIAKRWELTSPPTDPSFPSSDDGKMDVALTRLIRRAAFWLHARTSRRRSRRRNRTSSRPDAGRARGRTAGAPREAAARSRRAMGNCALAREDARDGLDRRRARARLARREVRRPRAAPRAVPLPRPPA